LGVRTAVGVLLLLAGTIAAACPVCIGSAARSPAKDLFELPRAVLAAPEGKQFRVLGLVKGEPPEALLEEVLVRDPADAGKPLLLVRDDAWPMWVSLGAIDPRGPGDVAMLREMAAPRPAQADAVAWRRRIELALPRLQSKQPLLAEIAYADAASAPYAALRAAKEQLDARALRRWLSDPQLAARRPLYLLLLGIAGAPGDAAWIDAQLEAAGRAHDAKNLAALLTADLELRGAARVGWIEQYYLSERAHKPAEVEAALLALSVQGNAEPGAIARERVIEAYRVFMREHPDMAGLVAQDLAAWRYWDAAPEYAALLKTGPRQQYASLAGILAYLRQSPQGAAR
jgi:hypothetical protein